MTLEELKREDGCMILNRPFFWQDRPHLLVCAIFTAEQNELWVLGAQSEGASEDEWSSQQGSTHRQGMSQEMVQWGSSLSVQSLAVQDISLYIQDEGVRTLDAYLRSEPIARFGIKYLLERGLDTSLYHHRLEDLRLYKYRVEGALPMIDSSDAITLTVPAVHLNLPVGMRFSIPIDTGLDEPLSFVDGISGESKTFYINRVGRYDLWGEMDNEFSKDYMDKLRQDGLSEAEIHEMRRGQEERNRQICPPGSDLLMVEYEIACGSQLCFYTTQYLDSISTSTSRSTAIHIFSDEEPGPHGYKVRYDVLMSPVPRDYQDDVEFELFSWYRQTPAETIQL